MKQRINEIIKTLKEIIEENSLNVSYDVLFTESLSIYRGERASESRSNYQKKEIERPATSKQLAYAQQLADNKKIEIKITGKETSKQISNLIKELQK